MRIQDDQAVQAAEGQYQEEIGEAPAGAAEGEQAPAAGWSWDWLLKKTGPGPLSDYQDHPLNWLEHDNVGLARVLRGMTGLLGDLDYALVDIGLGLVELVRPRANERAGMMKTPGAPHPGPSRTSYEDGN